MSDVVDKGASRALAETGCCVVDEGHWTFLAFFCYVVIAEASGATHALTCCFVEVEGRKTTYTGLVCCQVWC